MQKSNIFKSMKLSVDDAFKQFCENEQYYIVCKDNSIVEAHSDGTVKEIKQNLLKTTTVCTQKKVIIK